MHLLTQETWVSLLFQFGCRREEANCCSAEVLARYGSPEQKKKWLVPLLNGETRSAFAMTERFGMFNSLLTFSMIA